MFTKDPGLKPLSNIKSSERRKLIDDIAKTYKVPDHLGSELVPLAMKKATYKSPLGHSGSVYTDLQHVPLYFKTRDSNVIPTIYTLWKNPTLLPVVYTNSYVIHKLQGGANLMLPGTIPPFDPRCVKNALVGIASYEEPYIVKAVGICQLNLTQFTSTNGRSGVAVQIWHFNGDELEKISKTKLEAPDNKTIEKLIKERETGLVGLAENVEKLEIDDQSIDNGINNEELLDKNLSNEESLDKKLSNGELLDKNLSNEESLNKNLSIEEPSNKQSSNNNPSNKLSSNNYETYNEPEQIETLRTEDIDYLFKRAFLLTLFQEQIKPPISASNFISNHLLKNLPNVSSSLDHLLTMKKTSWKKSAKFFKEMEKAKYLKLKGKDDSLTILEVATKQNNEQIRNFVPYKVKKITSTSVSSAPTPKKLAGKLNVVILYKPNSKTRPFFETIGADYNHYYNVKQVGDLVNTYIVKRDLVNPRNKKTVVLDAFLNSLINANSEQCVMPREKIVPGLLKYFTQCYKILQPDESISNIDLTANPPIKGSVPKIKIISEYKLGRKIITRISNFETFNIVTADQLAQYLKVKCSGSTTVGKAKENPKWDEVVVQGPHIPTVTQFFTDHGVSPNYMEVVNKIKSKKK